MFAFTTTDRAATGAEPVGFVIFLGAWIITFAAITIHASTVTKVLMRASLIGALEWIAVIPAGMLLGSRITAQTSGDLSGNISSRAGEALGPGMATVISGWFAVVMAVICMVIFAVTFSLSRNRLTTRP